MNNKFNRIDNDILEGTDRYLSLLERKLSKNRKLVIELETKHKSFAASINKDPDLAKSLVRKTISPEMCIESITIRIQRLRKWSAQAVTFEINGGNILQKLSNNIIYQ